jgi:hypothetical protein
MAANEAGAFVGSTATALGTNKNEWDESNRGAVIGLRALAGGISLVGK